MRPALRVRRHIHILRARRDAPLVSRRCWTSIGTETIWRFTSGEGPLSAACGATCSQLALMIGSKIGIATPEPVPAAAERAALAAIVVADPDRDRHVIGEADEPGVVLLVAGAGLAADVMARGTRCARAGAARQHALQDALELEERDLVGRADRDQRRCSGGDRSPCRRVRPTRPHAAPAASLRWRWRRRRSQDRSPAPAARPARTGSSGMQSL